MLNSTDAFGQGLLEYMLNGRCEEIIERDDGYIRVAQNGEYFTGYKQWTGSEKKAIKFVKGRILDIGCGAGRHGIYLQKKGYNVLGIDNSPLAVYVSRKMGMKNVRELSIENISVKLGKFDTILMLGHNFGLFQNADKLRKLLHRMDLMTEPGALIIAESMDPHKTSNKVNLEYHRRNINRDRLPGQVRMRVRIRNIIGKWFDYLFVSKKEMRQLLGKTAWKIKKIIGTSIPSYVAIIEKR